MSVGLLLSMIRRAGSCGDVTLIPRSHYRGAYHAASLPSGGAYTCMPAQPCLYVVWPKKHWGAYFGGGDPANCDWAGSLIRGSQDVSGLMYRRNRYYDPATGQFTQSDPIGSAGGLNTYGFAAGDPISFTDPFGLKADTSFTGADNGAAARAAWHQMRAEAEAAAASGDDEKAAAGTMLLTMMKLVENSDVMYADQRSTFRLLFQGHETCTEVGRCRITLDHTHQTDQSLTVRLAHEVGGVFLGRNFGMGHDTGAMIGENMARSMNGCRRRGGHNPFEYPGGPC